MKLLHIDSSILRDASVTRAISRRIVERCVEERPDMEVTYRDLAEEPIPHLTGDYFMAVMSGADGSVGAELKRDLEFGDKLIEEFSVADFVVIGAPMYNFAVPSNLKAYFDRLAVPGRTFRYTSGGHVGLLRDRPVVVASARGNLYEGTHHASSDQQEPFIRSMLDLMGIHTIHVIRAEGVALGDELKRRGVEKAMTQADNRAFYKGLLNQPS